MQRKTTTTTKDFIQRTLYPRDQERGYLARQETARQ